MEETGFLMRSAGSEFVADGSGRVYFAYTLPDNSLSGPDRHDLRVLRLTADGQKDSTFGVSGVATVIQPGAGATLDVWDVVVVGSAGVLVLVLVDTGSSASFRLVRVSASGSLDPSFGVGGELELAAPLCGGGGTPIPGAANVIGDGTGGFVVTYAESCSGGGSERAVVGRSGGGDGGGVQW